MAAGVSQSHENVLLKLEYQLLCFFKGDLANNILAEIADCSPQLLQFSPLSLALDLQLQIPQIRLGSKLLRGQFAELLTATRVLRVQEVQEVQFVQTSARILLRLEAARISMMSSFQLPAHALFPLVQHRLHQGLDLLDHDPVHALRPLQLGYPVLELVERLQGKSGGVVGDEGDGVRDGGQFGFLQQLLYLARLKL